MSKIPKFFVPYLKLEIILPFVLMIAYLFFILVVRQSMPTSEEIMASLSNLYKQYGYQIIFIAAILEALILVNVFIPGMVAVGMGVVFARVGQLELPLVILIASLGLIIGYVIDYILGFLGISFFIKALGYEKILVKTRDNIIKYGNKILILGFIYSTVAAFLSLAAGTLRMNFLQFISIATLSTLFWLTIWGIIVYAIGEVFIHLLTKYSFLIILVIMVGFILLKLWGKGEKKI